MKKMLFLLTGAAVGSAMAAITPLRIVPDKIVYDEGETGTLEVVVRNTGDTAATARIEISETWGIEGEGRALGTYPITLEPGVEATNRVVYPGSKIRYGHEVRALAKTDGRESGSRVEYFNVNDDWWRVSQGMGMETKDASRTPLSDQLCRHHGYDPSSWEVSGTGHFSSTLWERRLPGMGPFIGYGTLETRWHIEQSSVGGNFKPSTYPLDEVWYAITGERRTNRGIHRDTDITHSRGCRHTHFTINLMEGPHGFELARRHPEWIKRTNRGAYDGHYWSQKCDPARLSRLDERYDVWSFVYPNFYREDVIDWALDDLARGVRAYREDGVYFDGRYVARGGHEWDGSPLEKKYDGEAVALRNMDKTLDVLVRDDPRAFIWSNGPNPGIPEASILNHPQSGLLDEIQWGFLLHPTMPCNTPRGFLEILLKSRNLVYLQSKYVSEPSKNLIVGYLSSAWTPKPSPDAARESWAMCNHVMALVCSVLGHPFAGSLPMRPYKQMLTRYSEFFWHEDIKVMEDGYKKFVADSLNEIWYDDQIYTRETADHVDYYVHLVNAPEDEVWNELQERDPPEADDVEVATTLFETEAGKAPKLRAWAIQPHGYLAGTPEPSCEAIVSKTIQDETVFVVPPFTYYTLLVIRAYK